MLSSAHAQEHLLRWIKGDRIFQVAGWGCGSSLYDLRAFLQKKLRREFASPKELSYCNAVLDTGLWIIASTAELMAAQLLLDEALRLNERDREELKDYLRAASNLLRDRSTPKFFRREDGSTVQALPILSTYAIGRDDSKAFLSVSNARRVAAPCPRQIYRTSDRSARYAAPRAASAVCTAVQTNSTSSVEA